ncbi:ATP-dependent DNA ligase [Cesiribacter sp. SM1]|uniref:ATP-dependent DNA ligase n=1 Tax=Cesiribacter sp. SM1 TaxID=2861196 RepID=UPI001CD28123|nr:ATP-dependent DNA ligase [Cesiribacter sp. SM1]
MRQFAHLFAQLDQTNKTNEKLFILKEYLAAAPPKDILWALALFTGKRPRRPVNSTLLRHWAAEAANLPLWLFEESYHVVGDLSETIALLLPPPQHQHDQPLAYWMDFLRNLHPLEEADKKAAILEAWDGMDKVERFVFNKLMSGSFRIGISQNLMVRAVAEVQEMDPAVAAHRLMGNWDPLTTDYDALFGEEDAGDRLSRPYPFYLAHALETGPHSLGDPHEWQAEWKWDGIRSQLIYRQGELYIWSRGEELVTDKYPELLSLQEHLPYDCVIDGELLPVKEGTVMPFAALQTRIGRKIVSRKQLSETPVRIYAYDLLELKGEDIRQWPLEQRRQALEQLVQQTTAPTLLELSAVVDFNAWEELQEARNSSRSLMAEGLMLKKKDSAYGVGRKRGDWWKWKIDPLTIDGVLVYAQKGSGRRADLYTDYTFAVWDEEEKQLVPFAKAYSGLSDAEIRRVDNFVKRNTRERFGPVRTVSPELVFEIAFEGIQKSSRHKSGVAIRFPRILRWRLDKKAQDANTLRDLQDMLNIYGS